MTSAGREQRKAADTAHPRSKAATRTYGGECVFAPAVKSRSQGTGVHNLGDAAAWHVHHGCGVIPLLIFDLHFPLFDE